MIEGDEKGASEASLLPLTRALNTRFSASALWRFLPIAEWRFRAK